MNIINNKAVTDYIENTIRLWLGLKKSHNVEIPNMPDYLKSLFLRTEEYENKHRDQWGTWEHTFSTNYQEGKLWIPEVSNWIKENRNNLMGNGISLEPLWPNNHSFAICLTHDVDHISNRLTIKQKGRYLEKHIKTKGYFNPGNLFEILRILAGIILFKGISLYPSTLKTIELILQIEKGLGVVSSFFFTVYPISKYSQYDCIYSLHDFCSFRGEKIHIYEMVKIIANEGFDIGLHGSYYSAIDQGLLTQQNMVLEDAIGFKVITTRQHYLNWDINITPRLQSEAGLLCDSTLGFNRNIGFRNGVAFPFYLFDIVNQKITDVLEVPLVIQEAILLNSNSLEYDFAMAKDVTKKIIDRIIECDGCASILFHPHSFYDKVYEDLYHWIIEYCLEKNGWVTSLRNIYKWWKKREVLLEQ